MKKQKTNRFAGKVTKDANRQKTASSSFGYLRLPKGLSMFSAEPGGRITVDIMPYIVTTEAHPDRDNEFGIAVPGEPWYKRPFRIHRNVGIGKDTVVCLTSFGKKCPICEYRTKRVKEGAEKDELDQLRSTQRNLYCVISIGDKKLESVPMIWDVSQFLFQELLNDELMENPEYEGFPDLEEGLSLKIRFDSKTMPGSKPFAEASRIDFENRKHTYGDEIMDEIPSLDDLLIEIPYKELEAKFFEMEPDPNEDDDEPASNPVRKKYSKPIPEPEPDDDDDDEDDEPEPVKKSSFTRNRKPIPEPEPDDDDDEEGDEPAPAPVRKRKPELAPAPKGKEKNKCPFGHRFGKDCDAFNDCNNCDVWDDCVEEQEG